MYIYDHFEIIRNCHWYNHFFPMVHWWLSPIQKAPGLTGIHAARRLNCFKTRALPAVPILCRSL